MTCQACNGLFPKQARGRPPKRCPECRAGGVTFVPTADWQTVPEGAVLPPGCQVEMDVSTGRNRARLSPSASDGGRPADPEPFSAITSVDRAFKAELDL